MPRTKKQDYLFWKEMQGAEMSVLAEPTRETLSFNLFQSITKYGHRTELKEDDMFTKMETRFYIPGLLTQTSVSIYFGEPYQKNSKAEAWVHVTGLIKRLDPRIKRDLETEGFRRIV